MQTQVNHIPLANLIGKLNNGVYQKDKIQRKSGMSRFSENPAFADTIARLELGRIPGERNWHHNAMDDYQESRAW